MNKIIAVYGTLKKGKHNNYILGDSPCVGGSYIEFSKMASGGYPRCKFGQGGKYIKVELYRVCDVVTLERLDRLEGYIEGCSHNLYNRIEVVTACGKTVEVYDINSDLITDEPNRFVEYKMGNVVTYNWQ